MDRKQDKGKGVHTPFFFSFLSSLQKFAERQGEDCCFFHWALGLRSGRGRKNGADKKGEGQQEMDENEQQIQEEQWERQGDRSLSLSRRETVYMLCVSLRSTD